jgi:hypothetical protein
MQALPLKVNVVGVKSEDLACERGFSDFLGTQESATIRPNQTVSVFTYLSALRLSAWKGDAFKK